MVSDTTRSQIRNTIHFSPKQLIFDKRGRQLKKNHQHLCSFHRDQIWKFHHKLKVLFDTPNKNSKLHNMCNICTLINYNRICHKIFVLLLTCQVIHTISHCPSWKKIISAAFIIQSFTYSSTVNGFNFYAIIWQTATLPWAAAVFDLVAMANIFRYHCISDLRFCNLSSLRLTSRALKNLCVKCGANCIFLAFIPTYCKWGKQYFHTVL
jgi:hypothetical protein